MNPVPVRSFALAGPGRAGSSLALALVAAGWRAAGVTGRSVAAASTRAAVARLGCAPCAPGDLGRGASLVVIATPDAGIEEVAAAIAPGLEAGTLVVHCAGARGLDALAPIERTRSDVTLGALHPLQTFAATDPARLVGAWAAVAGPPEVTELALSLGLRPFVVADGQRAAYHAAAVVASNHVVALLGQVTRLAETAGVPADAVWPLVHATVANVEALGAVDALTGPVARGDLATVAAHLDAIDPAQREAYVAMARAALALTERDDPALRDVLAGRRGGVLA